MKHPFFSSLNGGRNSDALDMALVYKPDLNNSTIPTLGGRKLRKLGPQNAYNPADNSLLQRQAKNLLNESNNEFQTPVQQKYPKFD